MSKYDEWYLAYCDKVAELAMCGRKKAGAIIVNPANDEIISRGWNAPPRECGTCTNKYTHINDGGCLNDEGRCVRTVHAEQKAIHEAKRDITGFTLYCTTEPCEICTKSIVDVGIRRVVYKDPYKNKYNRHFNGPVEWERWGDKC